MDPDATLKALRDAVARWLLAETNDSEHAAALDMADAATALDGWLTSGGFLPDEWRKD